jgi:hypothetical protein
VKPLALIYCAAGNPRLMQIAVDAGWRPGAQLPGKVYHEPYFVDQNWKKPVRAKYMAKLAEFRPNVATVLDLEREHQLDEVLSWAEEAAQHVQEAVIIIPKALGMIARLPKEINGVPVRLGYSVPTRYGGTHVPISEFGEWPVHLLGGSPQKQMSLARGWIPRADVRLAFEVETYCLNVVSADTNYHQKMAIVNSSVWVNGTATRAKNVYFPQLQELGEFVTEDAPYVAFEKSCRNIIQAWQDMGYAVNEQPYLIVAQ